MTKGWPVSAPEQRGGITRRTALRGAAVGAGLVWTAPVVTTLAAPAFAETSAFARECPGMTAAEVDAAIAECVGDGGTWEDVPFCECTPASGGGECDERHPDWDASIRDCCDETHPQWSEEHGDCRHAATGTSIATGLAAGTGMVATGATLAALASRRGRPVDEADTAAAPDATPEG